MIRPRCNASLKDAGCRKIFEEKVSGAKRARGARSPVGDLREGDVVVVSRLDRLARSTRDLLTLAEEIAERGAGLRSLAELWGDTTSAAGKMVLTVFAGIAEFERSLILQRTGAGRTAAQARGVRFGRPAKIKDDRGPLRALAAKRFAQRAIGCEVDRMRRATLYRAGAAQPKARKLGHAKAQLGAAPSTTGMDTP